jgi:hypothetical protein
MHARLWRFPGYFIIWMSVFLGAPTLRAQVIRYVTPDGAGIEDGSDWDNPYAATALQTAVEDGLAVAGSIVYLQLGEYYLTTNAHTEILSGLDLSGAAGMTLSGGWAGNDTGGLPGAMGTEPTVLRRVDGYGLLRISVCRWNHYSYPITA